MSGTDRLCRIDQPLHSRRSIARRELLEALECSQVTLTRDIEYLRSQLNAPIILDGDLGAYQPARRSILEHFARGKLVSR